jgi:nuclear transport factor 2 (NTF2) superfamily protein
LTDRPPLPPFTLETATQKVQTAEDAWNTRDPERVAAAYTVDSVWRNRDTFVTGREEIVAFLTAKWERELDYALRKNLWSFGENRIAVRFQYESHDAGGQWWRSYGNELWKFDERGRCAGERRASTMCRSTGGPPHLRAAPADDTARAPI